MLFVFLIGLFGSAVGFALTSAFVSKGHVQRGTVQLLDNAPDEYRVVFVTRYKVIPQVTIACENDMDVKYYGGGYSVPEHRKFRVELGKVTTSGFLAIVHRLPWKTDGKGEKKEGSYLYRLPLEARFRWRAEGLPDPQYDARSQWLRLTVPQRVFSVAGVLFFIGLAADLLGIVSAAMQFAGQ